MKKGKEGGRGRGREGKGRKEEEKKKGKQAVKKETMKERK